MRKCRTVMALKEAVIATVGEVAEVFIRHEACESNDGEHDAATEDA